MIAIPVCAEGVCALAMEKGGMEVFYNIEIVQKPL